MKSKVSAHQSHSTGQLSLQILVWVTPLLLAVLILLQTGAFRNSKSPTYDETYYLSTALKTVQQGSLDDRISDGGVAPLPIMVDYLPIVWNTGGSPRSEPWEGEISDPPMIRRARFINAVLIGIPTMVLVYCWLCRRRGYLAALLGACLVIFSPTMEAHFSLATTDAFFSLLALIALAVLTRYWKRPTIGNLVWLAVSVSLAISAKYSGIFLLPCTLIVVLLVALQKGTASSRAALWSLTKRVTLVFSLFLLLVVPLTWACHLFSFTGPLKAESYSETSDDSAWVRVLGRGSTAQWIMDVAHNDLKRPAPFAGILFQILHNSAGHDTYLSGELSKTGWWYYFLLAWFWKSTPVELLLTLLGLLLIFWMWRDAKSVIHPAEEQQLPVSDQGRDGSTEPTAHAPLIWVLAAAVLLGMSLNSQLNLGQRYLFLLYPLLFLFTIDQVWRWFPDRKLILACFCFFCIVFQFNTFQSVKPHYLSYFNSLAGGPLAGHEHLLDSNLDWGQDLPALKAVLDELPDSDRKRCLLAYFGTARPKAYGIDIYDLKDGLPEQRDQWKYLIVSANYLHGLYTKGDLFFAFRKLPPSRRVANSIFIFDVQTPAGRKALLEFYKVAGHLLSSKQ